MTKLERLEKKVAYTKAASVAADKVADSYYYAEIADTGSAAYAAWVACADTTGAYLQAMDELKECIREQDSEQNIS
jgi:hypothetical protein